jgi:hypothetical protein
VKIYKSKMKKEFAKLELVWRSRQGGKGRTERKYLDFTVNGQSLKNILKIGDYIGCLGWTSQEVENNILDQLFLRIPSDLGNDRYSIYVCPECGDIGFGVITVQIEKTSDGYVWKNFGYENNYDDSMRNFESYKRIGPFYFKESEYKQALMNRPPWSHDSP